MYWCRWGVHRWSPFLLCKYIFLAPLNERSPLASGRKKTRCEAFPHHTRRPDTLLGCSRRLKLRFYSLWLVAAVASYPPSSSYLPAETKTTCIELLQVLCKVGVGVVEFPKEHAVQPWPPHQKNHTWCTRTGCWWRRDWPPLIAPWCRCLNV